MVCRVKHRLTPSKALIIFYLIPMRQFCFRLKITVVCLILFWVGLGPGCGGSGGGGGGEGDGGVDVGSGSGVTLDDTLATFDTVAEVMATALNTNTPPALFFLHGEGLAKKVSKEIHVHCDTGGPAVVTGDIIGDDADGTFDLSVSFDDCSGVDGTAMFSGTYESGADGRDFAADISGSVGGNGCLLVLDDAGYLFTVDPDVIAAPTAETLTGTMEATCPATDSTVSCDFGSGVDALDLTALAATCVCTGGGCED